MFAPILNTVLPVFLLIGLGQALMRLKLAGPEFFQTSDRLVYYIFFPALLFWKIGAAGPRLDAQPGLIVAVLGTVLIAWLLSLAWCRWRRVSAFQVGSFSQVSYRFNTYVGLAVVVAGFGEPGVATFGIIISLAIPFINVLAVSTLIWFSQADYRLATKLRLVAKALVVNPLILACLAGLAWARFAPPLPEFVTRAFALLSAISLPLALLSIGAGLGLAKLPGRVQLSLVSCVIKLALMPLIGWALLRLAGVDRLEMAVAMVFFCLPTATNAYILSAQMGSDADLAGAAIVLCTLLSFFSLSWVLVVFGVG